MAHHEEDQAAATTAEDATEGALGTPPVYPETGGEGGGGFDFWLFGLLVAVAIAVAVQNLWLRRRAQREGGEAE